MFSRKDKVKKAGIVGQLGQFAPGTGNLSTKGAYGLKFCHDAVDAVADIVFVHGLTGNRETTWTDKATGVFWPAHLLRNDVPKTRILTFGYDADITHFWASASQNCIRNHAVNLANALAQLRERTETENRPLIFVTHSLGGLVFEDAMLASKNSAEYHLQRIYDSTVGVCFLGTPHCGSALANWGRIFGQIANTVKTVNTSLLNVLEPESDVLSRIQGDFHAMVRTRPNQGRPPLHITCFYEELPVKGLGEIVPKHSAILPAYNSIGIWANHMDMVRFSSNNDQGYLSVSTELLRWVRAVQKTANPAAPPAPAEAPTAESFASQASTVQVTQPSYVGLPELASDSETNSFHAFVPANDQQYHQPPGNQMDHRNINNSALQHGISNGQTEQQVSGEQQFSHSQETYHHPEQRQSPPAAGRGQSYQYMPSTAPPGQAPVGMGGYGQQYSQPFQHQQQPYQQYQPQQPPTGPVHHPNTNAYVAGSMAAVAAQSNTPSPNPQVWGQHWQRQYRPESQHQPPQQSPTPQPNYHQQFASPFASGTGYGNDSMPQFHHGGNVVSGTVNNYGGGKVVQGGTFHGALNF